MANNIVGGGGKLTMAIRSQITKRGETDLNQSLMCIHTFHQL